MTLKDLGLKNEFLSYLPEEKDSYLLGRVSAVHRDRYRVLCSSAEIEAELLGNLRYSVESKTDLPVVGDWVVLRLYDEMKGLIHLVLPRFSSIERQAVGVEGEKQIIATNIDFALIVQSVNRDFNLNRIERYLTICQASQIKPILILSKIDLIDNAQLSTINDQLKKRIPNIPCILISNISGMGISELKQIIQEGMTYCLLGSSGVGKSTLLNILSSKQLMVTSEISEKIDRGKHTTTYRQLILLPEGGVMIDNPGMREVGITESREGLLATFEEIYKLAKVCKYSDCSHIEEDDCAVLQALDSGNLDPDLYTHYQKLVREAEHFRASLYEKRQKDKKSGKLYKQIMKNKKKNKF